MKLLVIKNVRKHDVFKSVLSGQWFKTKEKQQTVTFVKLAPKNFWHFFALINDLNDVFFFICFLVDDHQMLNQL